jgi:hypothetical protein
MVRRIGKTPIQIKQSAMRGSCARRRARNEAQLTAWRKGIECEGQQYDVRIRMSTRRRPPQDRVPVGQGRTRCRQVWAGGRSDWENRSVCERGAGRGGRTPMTRRSADFESAASASSAIPARVTNSILNDATQNAPSAAPYLRCAVMASSARFSSRTFTRGSPRNPNCLGSMCPCTNCPT